MKKFNKILPLIGLICSTSFAIAGEEYEILLDQATAESQDLMWRRGLQAMDGDKLHLLLPVPVKTPDFPTPSKLEEKAVDTNIDINAAPITVGSTGSCTYPNLQQAVNAATSGETIHVSAETFTGNDATVNIGNKNLTIIGGYSADCSTFLGTRSTLDGLGMTSADSILEIFNSSNSTTINISYMNINNGLDDADDGGGIEISGDLTNALQVNLSEVGIAGNDSENGAGIHITNATLNLADNTTIWGNTATLDGGGVYCVNSTIVAMTESYIGAVFIFPGNTAINGGGFRLDNCDLVLGGNALSTTGAYVLSNTVTEKGGGIYAINSSRIDLHGDKAWINLNNAKRGGGLYMAGSSDFYGDNGKVNGNTASLFGGGFYLIDAGTIFDMDRVNNYPCTSKCSELSENQAQSGGAGFVTSNTTVDIESSWVEGNQAMNDAMAFFSFGTVNLSGTMLVNQQSNGNVNDLIRIGDGTTTITHSTIAGTQVVNGSSAAIIKLYNSATAALIMNNSIVWSNDLLYTNLYTTTLGQSVSLDNNILEFNQGGTNLLSDPQFINNASNYHIKPESPAVDYADATSIRDVDNESRDIGFSADSGADEAYLRVGIAGQDCQYSSISEAIVAASPGDTLYLSPSTYLESSLDINKSLTFVPAINFCNTEKLDATSQSVIIDGSSNFRNNGGVMAIASNADVVFRHMTIKNGNADFGGVIYTDVNSTLVLDDADVAGGVAQQQGGGIYSQGSTSMINGSAIYSNSSTVLVRSAGGAFQQNGAGIAIAATGSLTMENDSFIGGFGAGNQAVNDGGGVYSDGGPVTLRDNASIFGNSAQVGAGIMAKSTLLNLRENSSIGIVGIGGENTAIFGGGLYLISSTLNMEANSYVRNNKASTGAGVYVLSNGPQSNIIGGNIDGNIATGDGGGVYVWTTISSATVSLNATKIQNNTSVNGAGLSYNSNNAGGNLTIGQSTLINNTATNQGGGLQIVGAAALTSLTFFNSALVNNIAGTNGGGLSLENSSYFQTTGGLILNNNQAAQNGGGIYIAADGSIELAGGTLTGNVASNGSGGGVYASAISDGVFLTSAGNIDMTIQNNSALNGNGGAIYQLGGSIGFGRTIASTKNTNFSNNQAINGGALYLDSVSMEAIGGFNFNNNIATSNGGAIYASILTGGMSGFEDDRPLFSGNVAQNGIAGAVYIGNSSNTVTLLALDFGLQGQPNQAIGDGGAIYLENNIRTDLTNLNIKYNTSQGNGGGIYISSGETFIDTYTPSSNVQYFANPCLISSLPTDQYCSHFEANTSGFGGSAIEIRASSTVHIYHTGFSSHQSAADAAVNVRNSVNLDIANSLFENNAEIAALFLQGADTTFNISNSTFAGNASSKTIYQNISSGTTGTIESTILWGNTFGSSFSVTVAGDCNISEDASLVGLSVDPQFVTTPNGKYRLASGSPAIDACSSSLRFDIEDKVHLIDGDGSISGFERDMGAIEYGNSALADNIFKDSFE